MVHKIREFQRALPAQQFHWGGIHMAEHQVQVVLTMQPQGLQIRSFREDITQLDVFVFQGSFLPGLHGIAVEHPRPQGTICSMFHGIGQRKLWAPVGKQDVDIFAKQLRSQDGLQQIHTILHCGSGLFFMIEGKEEAGLDEFKGLKERAVRSIVIDRIHLNEEDIRVL